MSYNQEPKRMSSAALQARLKEQQAKAQKENKEGRKIETKARSGF